MTLTERYAARRCRFQACPEDRAPDAALCSRHLWDLYRHLLDRAEDGSFVLRRRFPPVDRTWERAA